MFRVAQIEPYPQSADCIRGGVYGLAQEQGKSMDVHVFDLPRIGEDNTVIKDGNVTVHRYNNPGKRQAFASLKVSKMIQEIKALNPDICHIHGTGLFAWLMYRGLTKEKQSVIVTIHGLLRIEKRNQLKARFSLKRFAQYLYQGAVGKALNTPSCCNCGHGICEADDIELSNSKKAEHESDSSRNQRGFLFNGVLPRLTDFAFSGGYGPSKRTFAYFGSI